MSRTSLAEFELLVMLAVSRLGSDAYGGAILREITARTGRSVSIGALYATLSRLEGKGMLTLSEGASGGPGRARRYAALTPDGLHATRTATDQVLSMLDGLSLPLKTDEVVP